MACFTLGGLIAGEGSFVITRKQPPFTAGDPRLRFVFTLTMAERDRGLLEALRQALGFGSIMDRPRARPHWQPTATFTINSLRGHRCSTIPFCEEYLPLTAKRRQFDLWRQALDAYEIEHPSRWGQGRSVCSEPSCTEPVRGQGLCRAHYYRATGH